MDQISNDWLPRPHSISGGQQQSNQLQINVIEKSLCMPTESPIAEKQQDTSAERVQAG